MDRKDFNFDFDFEKEYGFDPKTLEGPEYDGELSIDQLGFDLNDPIFDEEPQSVSAPESDPEVSIPEAPVSEDVPKRFDEDFSGDLPNISGEAFPSDDFELDGFSLENLELGDMDTDDLILDDMALDTLDVTHPEMELPREEYLPDAEAAPHDGFLPLESELPQEESAEDVMLPLEIEEDSQDDAQAAAEPRPERRRETRREKRQRIRRFKEEKLPKIIAAVAAGIMVFLALGAIIRGFVNKAANDKAQAGAEASSQSAAQQQDAEAQRLLAEAASLAAGYDYEAAIATLDSFSGEMSAYPQMIADRSSYNQSLSQLVAWSDPSKIPNLSFHVLIADPGRAFTNASLGKKYNQNFVTIDEFSKILQQLYDNGYVLVSMEDVFVESTSQSGVTTYAPNTIYLPSDKKPIMITETLVNYLAYMIDSDNDGAADKGGAGFASRLVLQNGEIKAELVTSTGETIVGDYDLVPILNSFIQEHPDFSYRGARAMLGICGHEGVFGYRTNKGVINTKGQAYYDEQVAGAKEVVAALKAEGYEIACYTYENIPYGSSDATKIKNDLTKWSEEVKPIVGEVDILIYAQTSDISDYTGSKYNVVYSSGFRYFINNASSPWAEITTNYVRQSRLMVTGTNMAYYSDMFSGYFNAMAVLNSARGTVPN